MALTRSSGGGGGGSIGGGGSGVNIAGNLNFGGGGSGMFTGGLNGLASAYANSYNSALAANSQNYSNVLAGYQQLAGQQQSNQNNIVGGYNALAGQQQSNQNTIMAGYNNLGTQVSGTLQGSADAQRQMIDRQYAQQAAQASQQMTSAGLNNTTVVNSLQRGITFDQQLAQTNLANQFAQLQAQYQSQLGLANLGYQDQANQQQMNLGLQGLGYQNEANQQQMGLGVQQLNWMNSVEIPYPDAGAYSQLAQYYGQQDQANQDRNLMSSLYGKMLGASSKPTGGGGFAGVYGKTQSAGGAMPYYGTTNASYGMPMGTSPGLGAANQGSSYGTPGSYSLGGDAGMSFGSGGYGAEEGEQY